MSVEVINGPPQERRWGPVNKKNYSDQKRGGGRGTTDWRQEICQDGGILGVAYKKRKEGGVAGFNGKGSRPPADWCVVLPRWNHWRGRPPVSDPKTQLGINTAVEQKERRRPAKW